MKQLVQVVKTGRAEVRNVPAPIVRSGMVLIRNEASLVSAGTERMVVEFANKGFIGKARARPDLFKQIIEKARREGVLGTLDAVATKLAQPLALGYSTAGVVLDVGPGVERVRPGDRVACMGGGYATHAEVVAVPHGLVARLPDTVTTEAGAFVTVATIALQGIRLAQPQVGETVAVIGLGLLGQLTVQMLKAAGCHVIGLDVRADRADLALKCGASAAASDPEAFASQVAQLSRGYGADAVLITADTRSDAPVDLAARVARDKGVVVQVGVTGTNLRRKSFFEKELRFYVSRSTGPGRYDPEYEEKGHDYPVGYVRWTEGRNMEAVIDLLSDGRVNTEILTTHRFPINRAAEAYELIQKGSQPSLAVLLIYPAYPNLSRKIERRSRSSDLHAPTAADRVSAVQLGVLGAGNFATAALLPVVKKVRDIKLVGITSRAGLSAQDAAERFDMDFSATESAAVFEDPAVNTVAILTRHDLHGPQVLEALKHGKHVFVEKPLCLTREQLDAIRLEYQSAVRKPMIMVGYNRRFAPFVVTLKKQLAEVAEPLVIQIRVNAGHIPAASWHHDPQIGGGRLRGEGCHFIDLAIFLADDHVTRVFTKAVPNSGRYHDDNFVTTLEFANGSIATISYVANGNKRSGKEMIEVFGGGLSARIDDYRRLEIHGPSRATRSSARLRIDKGHRMEWEAIAAHLVHGAPAPIAVADLFSSTAATLSAYQSLITGEAQVIER